MYLNHFFFFSSRRRHTRSTRDWSSDVCSSDLYELKREYQKFLQERNRDRADSDGRPDRSREEIKQWAIEHDLPVVNDRVQFPDFRIEYEHADGRRDVENIEVTTVHYRGMHASGKAAAGFTRFRGSTARIGGSNRNGSSSPFDPHAAEELL